MRRFKDGQDPAAGGDHRHRGGRGRAQRHAHGHRERRAHGARATAPAARPRGPGSACELLPAAVSRAAVAAGARAARRDARHQRRIRGGAARSRAARTGRTARHAPDRARADACRRSCCATPICCRGCRSPRRHCCAIGRRTSRRSSAAGWDMGSNTAASVRMARHESDPNAPATLDAHTEWLPAERLGQLDMDARMRPWLIGKGLITLRMKEVCGDALRPAPDRAVDRPAERRASSRALRVGRFGGTVPRRRALLRRPGLGVRARP